MTELYSHNIHTPLGLMQSVVSKAGLHALSFVEQNKSDHIQTVKLTESYSIVEKKHKNHQLIQDELLDYFFRKRSEFTISVQFLHGTDFQKRVWVAIQDILYGKTESYLELAKKLGDVKAIRAVAAANGKNPVAIVVPCHRVIGSDGSLTGYAGGLERKKALLKLEGVAAYQTIQKELFT